MAVLYHTVFEIHCLYLQSLQFELKGSKERLWKMAFSENKDEYDNDKRYRVEWWNPVYKLGVGDDHGVKTEIAGQWGPDAPTHEKFNSYVIR